MPYKFVQNPIRSSEDDTAITICAIIMAVIFFSYILPKIERRYMRRVERMTNVKKALRILSKDDKIDKRLCSRQCCKYDDAYLPKELIPKGPLTKEQLKQYVKSSYTCTGGNGSGCPCIKKEQMDYYANRGQ